MNTKRIIGFLLPSLIVLALLAYVLGVNLVFILANELDVETTFTTNTFDVSNGETIELAFVTLVDSPNACTTKCNFILRNDQTNKILYNESKTVGSRTQTAISYIVDETHEGEVYLSFDVACNNLVSPICSTSQDKYYETSFISIAHTLNVNQEQKQNSLKEYVEGIFLTQATINNFLWEYNKYVKKIPFLNDKFVASQQVVSLGEQQELLDVQKEDIVTQWSQGLYEEMDVSYVSQVYDEYILFEEKTFLEKTNISNILDKTNEHLLLLQALLLYEDELLYLDTLENQSSLSDFIENVLEDILELKNKSTSFNFTSSQHMFSQIDQLNEDVLTLYSIYEDREEDIVSEIAQQTSVWLDLENNSSLQNIPQSCNDIQESMTVIKQYNDDALALLLANYSTEIQNSSFNQSLDAYAQSVYLNTSFNDTNYPYENITAYHQNWSNDLDELFDVYCFTVSTSSEFIPQQINTTLSFRDIEVEELPEMTTPCCTYGVCAQCSNQTSYPLILVHGHALTAVTSAEAALHSFSKIQRELESVGYMNVGELNDYPTTSWENINAPLSIRVSYYYLSVLDVAQYQFYTKKYESIETYAIRLKELVEEVKEKTNQDKVTILAHSMGGLVTRQYLALFGEESVDKIILVGTPNHGVTGASQKFCGLTGANKECEEMAKDSIFLKRLEQFVPSQTKVYTIAGIGCSKGGLDGDGVVSLESVQLPYADNTIIQGSCNDALQSDLHKNLIDPDKYPQVMDRIKEIIAE